MCTGSYSCYVGLHYQYFYYVGGQTDKVITCKRSQYLRSNCPLVVICIAVLTIKFLPLE